MLQELIQKLQDSHGLSAEQSHGVLGTVTGFIKEKFPMLGGAVDNMFPQSGDAAPTAAAAPEAAAQPAESGSIMDKISDVIPGDAGQKVEDFAKNAAHKAEDMFDSVKGKLGGLFGGDKK